MAARGRAAELPCHAGRQVTHAANCVYCGAVDIQGVRLPLRKAIPASAQASASTVAHSPLYPDGLMAPIWVKKHVEMVPAVFVMFLRLYEPPGRPSDEGADAATLQARREADKAMEKDADEGLVREIAERRRRLGERGIKLTVVLMATAAALGAFNDLQAGCIAKLTGRRRPIARRSSLPPSPSLATVLQSLPLRPVPGTRRSAARIRAVAARRSVRARDRVLQPTRQAGQAETEQAAGVGVVYTHDGPSSGQGADAARVDRAVRVEGGVVCRDPGRAGRSTAVRPPARAERIQQSYPS